MKKFIAINQAKASHLLTGSRYNEKYDFNNPLHRLGYSAVPLTARELVLQATQKGFDNEAPYEYKSAPNSKEDKKGGNHCKNHANEAVMFEEPEGKHNYKTLLCRNWWNGRCRYGDKCAFAHGTNELRVAIKNPFNYKTEQCRLYEAFSWCPYSYRCQFKHGSDESEVQDAKTVLSKKTKTRGEISDYKAAILEPTNYSSLTFEDAELDANRENRLEAFKAIPLEQ